MSAAPRTLLDGQPCAAEFAADRGLAYGDGLFETLRGTPATLAAWPLHWRRLQWGCGVLGIPLPPRAACEAELRGLLRAHGPGVVKLTVTRGAAGRGYATDPDAPSRRLAAWFPLPKPRGGDDGVELRLCAWRLARQPALAGIKHLGRLDSVMARREWHDPSIAEGLLRDAGGAVIEGTMSNLFVRIDHRWHTPALTEAGVAGVMRARLLSHFERAGTPVRIGRVDPDGLERADAALVCNSVIGLWPVRALRLPTGRRELSVLEETRRLAADIDAEDGFGGT